MLARDRTMSDPTVLLKHVDLSTLDVAAPYRVPTVYNAALLCILKVACFFLSSLLSFTRMLSMLKVSNVVLTS